MREFTAVSPRLWQSQRFQALKDSDAQLVFVYLLTGPHQTCAGYSRVNDQYGAADLDWPLERYRQAKQKVIDAGLVIHDPETAEIFIDKWFPFSGALGEKNLTGIDKILVRIESEEIAQAVVSQMDADLTRRADDDRIKTERKRQRVVATPQPSNGGTQHSGLVGTRLVSGAFGRGN